MSDKMDDLRAAGEEFLAAGEKYWNAAKRAGVYGAVTWLQGKGGHLCIFTRGEYRETLLRNIEPHGDVTVFGAMKEEEPEGV